MNEKDPEDREQVEDLDVPESESEDVKGGRRLSIEGESTDSKHPTQIELS